LTCGVEDYPFINPIPQDNITQRMNSQARVVIPNSNLGNMYFTHFIIFYRIYISDMIELSPSESNLNNINSDLNSHHSRVKPYIGNDSMGSSSIETLFSSMGYFPLELEDAKIENVLNTGSFNRTLVIDFQQAPGSIPYLTLGSTEYRLRRINGGENITILPENHYFVNSPDLRDPNNIRDSYINIDITDKSDAIDKRHTYVSMYIAAIGFNPQTYVQLYSSPAFIGVLCLPN
jgi:hypothetical protein